MGTGDRLFVRLDPVASLANATDTGVSRGVYVISFTAVVPWYNPVENVEGKYYFWPDSRQ